MLLLGASLTPAERTIHTIRWCVLLVVVVVFSSACNNQSSAVETPVDAPAIEEASATAAVRLTSAIDAPRSRLRRLFAYPFKHLRQVSISSESIQLKLSTSATLI